MKRSKVVVLDSWAIMAYLEDEPSAGKIGEILADSLSDESRLLMSVINAGEIWYTVARRRSEKEADDTIRWLKEMGVRLIDADWALTKIAAEFKAKGNISYADCYAAAVAKQNDGDLFTGDREFAQFERSINIKWL